MQEYEKKTISEVIEKVNDVYFLPDIQRNFVWKPDAIYKLFDSLMRQYPINTFLFWELNGNTIIKDKIKKIEFVRKSNQNMYQINDTINPEKTYYLVLDGQQRLTTFYLVLKGDYYLKDETVPCDLYFNVLSGVEEDEDDGILYEFKFFDRKKGSSFLSEKKDKKTKNIHKKIWVNIKDIYMLNASRGMQAYVNFCQDIDKTYGIQLTGEQQNAISIIHNALKNENVINYFPEKENNYDKVLDIFVRTNSGGTKLEYSDLLFANIKAIWKEAREEFDNLLFTINDNDRYDFIKDNILKTILLINGKDVSDIKYKTKNFKPDLINIVKEDKYWKKFCSAFKFTVDLLNDQFNITDKRLLTANNAIIPIIYWVFKNGIKAIGTEKNCLPPNDNNLTNMRIWLIKSLLSGLWAGQSDSILIKCKEALDLNLSVFDGKVLEDRIANETKKSMEYETKRIDKVSYMDDDSYLILSIVYKSAVNFRPRSERNRPQQDHLFSKDELSSKYPIELVNSIYNIRFVGASPNQIKSCKPFKEWIATQTDADKEMHLIPDGNWDTNNYNEFLLKRKELIVKNFSY